MSSAAAPTAVAGAARGLRRRYRSGSSVGSALASRLGLTALLAAFSLVTTPLLLTSLGVDGFGAYALIVAIPALLPFVDAGLGAAVTGSVAAASRRNQLGDVTGEVSAAAVLLAGAGLVLAVAVLACAFLVNWAAVLGVTAVPAGTVQLSVTVTLLCFAAGLPLSLAGRVLVGLEKTHVATLLGGLVAAVLGLAGIIVAAQIHAPLWGFVIVSSLATLVGAAACATWVRIRYPDAAHLEPAGVDLGALKHAARTALPFAVMAIATAVAYETDLLVVSHRLGEQAVAEFAVALKYFNLVYPAIVAAGVALWPLLVHAAQSREVDVRRSVVGWTFVFGLGGITAAAALALSAPWFIELWTGDRIEVSGDLVAARAVFLALSAVHYPASMAVLALGGSRIQAVTLPLMAMANLPLSILLADAVGVAGPVWASCACFGALHAIPLLIIALRRRAAVTVGGA
jgi:O-antigen/teichoic acid export membrane protein